jgi:acyl-CoA dehydrogenase
VGRKLPKDGGRALRAFFGAVSGYIKEHSVDAEMAPFVKPLGRAVDDLQRATTWLMRNALGKPDNAGAGATDYMHLFGLVALGYMWCLIADTARTRANAAAAGDSKAERMKAKLAIGRFFMERMLPATATHLARLTAGAASTMALPAEAF